MPMYILGTQSTDEDLQKRALLRLGWPETARQCHIFDGIVLEHILNVGRLSSNGEIPPRGPVDDNIYETDMATSLPQMATRSYLGPFLILPIRWRCDFHLK